MMSLFFNFNKLKKRFFVCLLAKESDGF